MDELADSHSNTEGVVNEPAVAGSSHEEKTKTRKRSIGKFVLISFFVLTIFFLGSFFVFRTNGLFQYRDLAYRFLFADQSLLKSNQGRVNILVLGKGGLGHEAPDLTDTIMLVSVSVDKPSMVIISLPRDIWIASIRAKLNSAYYYGKKKPEGGPKLAMEEVGKITGLQVHYAAVIDFSVFKKVIDSLGGIEVDVKNGFVDNKFPIPGKENDPCGNDKLFRCRYKTIVFEKGKQIMDGSRALEFVRSRNAEGEEGTDLARESRQQIVISALKNKLLDKKILLSPDKIINLINTAKDYIETNLDEESAPLFARRLFISRDNQSSFTVPAELLINPKPSSKYDYQYVFVPKEGNWEAIKEWVQSTLR